MDWESIFTLDHLYWYTVGVVSEIFITWVLAKLKGEEHVF